MSLPAILFGVCTKEYFLEFTKANRNVAWLISPRPAYRLRVAELIDKGLDQVEKIFEIPITPKNTLSVRRLQMEALKMLDMRKHGGYTQRIEQKTLQRNINSSTPTNDPNQENLGEGSIEELQMQVDNLQKRIEIGQNQNGSLLNTGPAVSDDTQPIDVTPRTVS
jgi:hypothetical protein